MKDCPNIEEFKLSDQGVSVTCTGCPMSCIVNIDRWVNGIAVMRLEPKHENQVLV